MKPLDLQSERYSPMGNVASEGVLNQLGRPRMDILTVLIREAVQNSWDAKRTEVMQVRFGVSIRTLTGEQQRVLEELVFLQTPAVLSLHRVLRAGKPLQVLELWDRGTSGLGGPTRADIPDDSNEYRDFVDFLRNVGHPPDKKLGGGTFGYGKAALYVSSGVHTICVHTYAQHRGRPVRRFMAAALGERFSLEGDGPERGQYTGRHWWGRQALSDEIVDPEKGDDADAMADALGMPSIKGTGERGTTIMILDPVLMDRTPTQALNVMKQALLWYFWPKMIALPGKTPAMAFEMWHEGEMVRIPSPRDVAPVHGFVLAMDVLKRGAKAVRNNPLAEVQSIEAQRPKQHLGQLALVRFARRPRETADTGQDDGMMPFVGPAHHVALMRQAELVVKYVAGPALPTDMIEYAGVFLADAEVDRVFARAEPPTHDDWVHEYLNVRSEKTFIRVAYRRIDETLEAFVAPERPGTEMTEGAPLGAFASELGTLLMGQEGPGAGVHISQTRQVGAWQGESGEAQTGNGQQGDGEGERRSGKKQTRHTRARVTLVDEGNMFDAGSEMILIAPFIVTHAEGSRGTRVRARVGVVLDGNQIESDPPAGGKQPRVLRWKDPEHRIYPAGLEQSVQVPATSSGEWEVAVLIPGDFMVQVELQAQEVP